MLSRLSRRDTPHNPFVKNVLPNYLPPLKPLQQIALHKQLNHLPPQLLWLKLVERRLPKLFRRQPTRRSPPFKPPLRRLHNRPRNPLNPLARTKPILPQRTINGQIQHRVDHAQILNHLNRKVRRKPNEPPLRLQLNVPLQPPLLQPTRTRRHLQPLNLRPPPLHPQRQQGNPQLLKPLAPPPRHLPQKPLYPYPLHRNERHLKVRRTFRRRGRQKLV